LEAELNLDPDSNPDPESGIGSGIGSLINYGSGSELANNFGSGRIRIRMHNPGSISEKRNARRKAAYILPVPGTSKYRYLTFNHWAGKNFKRISPQNRMTCINIPAVNQFSIKTTWELRNTVPK
jgi:hypothetical protein